MPADRVQDELAEWYVGVGLQLCVPGDDGEDGEENKRISQIKTVDDGW